MNQHVNLGAHPVVGVEQACLEAGSLIQHIRLPLEPWVQSLKPLGHKLIRPIKRKSIIVCHSKHEIVRFD